VVVRLPLGIGIALAVAWMALLVALLLARPKAEVPKQALRLLPDLLRLLRRLAADGTLPEGSGLLLAYLVVPIDLVPDFVPVLGYADDAIMVAWVLRSVVRRAGPEPVRRHWPGSPDGLAAVWRLCGLPAIPAT
jgi:hypothetical protein